MLVERGQHRPTLRVIRLGQKSDLLFVSAAVEHAFEQHLAVVACSKVVATFQAQQWRDQGMRHNPKPNPHTGTKSLAERAGENDNLARAIARPDAWGRGPF